MKLLAFTEGHDHVCYRYRLEAFRPALLERNWHLEAEPLARGLLRRVGQLRDAGGADVVVLQRKLLPLWQLRILRKHARRLVYDFDDALYCRDSYHPKGTENWRRMLGFWATIYAADAVTGGNHHLCAKRPAGYRPNVFASYPRAFAQKHIRPPTTDGAEAA